MTFDLQLFEQLNQEYAAHPSHPSPRSNDPDAVKARGLRQAEWLNRCFGVRGKRCLEIGCGRGEVTRALIQTKAAEAVGVDIRTFDSWATVDEPNVKLLVRDISQDSIDDLGTFDLIFSFSVWEHIHRPLEALQAAKKLLARRGDFYLSANLYRGTQASHRYREVFFPWPHLLFSDEVFQEFYAKRGAPQRRAAWVNRLTAEQYLKYFRELQFSVLDLDYMRTPLDQNFYERFEDVLGRYPRVDLERDFIKVHLRHTPLPLRVVRRVAELEPMRVASGLGYATRIGKKLIAGSGMKLREKLRGKGGLDLRT